LAGYGVAHDKLVDEVFEPQRRAGNENPADAKPMREAVVARWREAINATLQELHLSDFPRSAEVAAPGQGEAG
jgi:hypothetical protein